jgi:radical SAM superfamily enzyme YgiQ (UPF0313 family)
MKNNLVVLINPGHDDEVPESIARSFGARSRDIPREDPPLSIINLGGFIRDHGYNVFILDTHVEPNYKLILKDLIATKPLAIGLSVILGKFTKNAITITKIIRSMDADIPIVWGGKLIHLAYDKIFKELDIDYVVVGDGEFSFLYLLDALRTGTNIEKIPGVGYKKNGSFVVNKNTTIVDDIDQIYQSEDFGWDLIKDKINYKQIPYFINLYTSRGCRFNCSFCYLRDLEQMQPHLRYRRRSAENVIKELNYLHNNFGINVFTFGDDDFLYDLKKVVPVLQYIRKRGFYIEHFWTHIHNLTLENIDLLKGICQTICYSVETASPRLQKILQKLVPVEKILSVNRLLRQAGINTVHNFLFGIPTETDKETKQNIDLIKQIKEANPYARANCYILSPIPETPIFDYGQKVAQKKIDWTLSDLANFHFRYMGESFSKFRPYLSFEDNLFYERATVLANELFTEINKPATEEQKNEIKASGRLKYIFGDLEEICYPEILKKKYILNEVITATEKGLPLPKIKPF